MWVLMGVLVAVLTHVTAGACIAKIEFTLVCEKVGRRKAACKGGLAYCRFSSKTSGRDGERLQKCVAWLAGLHAWHSADMSKGVGQLLW